MKDATTTSSAITTQPPSTTEPKPVEGDKPAVDKPAVPEKYADFKSPEGYTLDKAVIDEAAPIFKDLGLSQDGAQKLVDWYAAKQIEAAKAPAEAYSAMRKGWQTTTLADTELSSGTKLRPEVNATIGRAIDSFGDAALATEFRQAMDVTGAGDNHAFVKLFYKMAQQITEGRPVKGGGPSVHGQAAPDSKPASIASAMYPNLK